jgi:tripartite-type tricarboxylate transporter receptor subunit TctC
MNRRHVLLLAAIVLASAISTTAHAQKPLDLVTFFVGYPPGGATDTVARLVADAVQGKYADAVVVQDRPGAGGQIAAAYVKGQPADGSALLFTPAFPMVIHPHVYKDIRYDTLKDFTAVATTHFGTLALSVGPAVPANVRTLQDFVAWAKSNPDKASFGAPSGGSQHFTGLMLARDANIKLQLVTYRGGAPSVVDVLGAHVPAVITPLAEVLPYGREGKLRILATTARERLALAPDTPTLF